MVCMLDWIKFFFKCLKNRNLCLLLVSVNGNKILWKKGINFGFLFIVYLVNCIMKEIVDSML